MKILLVNSRPFFKLIHIYVCVLYMCIHNINSLSFILVYNLSFIGIWNLETGFLVVYDFFTSNTPKI